MPSLSTRCVCVGGWGGGEGGGRKRESKINVKESRRFSIILHSVHCVSTIDCMFSLTVLANLHFCSFVQLGEERLTNHSIEHV